MPLLKRKIKPRTTSETDFYLRVKKKASYLTSLTVKWPLLPITYRFINWIDHRFRKKIELHRPIVIFNEANHFSDDQIFFFFRSCNLHLLIYFLKKNCKTWKWQSCTKLNKNPVFFSRQKKNPILPLLKRMKEKKIS